MPSMEATIPAASTSSGYLAAEAAVKVDVTPDVAAPTHASSAAAQADKIYVSA